ncbi:MAG: hypothetical protein HOQ05_11530 [Corynebacteriales bacterium]|nr:hypothetical protein [Mycobacteriales bacterium]
MAQATALAALVHAGFARHATYRQATIAATFTNSVFGLLRTYVLLAVLGANAYVAGYSGPQLVLYVWLGQGLLGVVMLWGWNELSERINSGDVVIDLLRPIDLLWNFLAIDVGRALHAAMTRLIVPLLVGALVFTMYIPRRPITYLYLLCGIGLAVVISFALRYLVNLIAFWVLDARGFMILLLVLNNIATGLIMPIHFFPHWAQVLVNSTPFPAMFQTPLDIATERPGAPMLILAQIGWVIALLGLCKFVQDRSVHRLVVQGG